MPTNDERREVAARLREVKTFAINRPIDELDALMCAVGCSICQEHWRVHLADRLADLIEPEERTCELKKAHWDNGSCTWGVICSACGYKHEHESGLCWNYCPNCGARVVE